LGRRINGRSDDAPPTDDEFERLLLFGARGYGPTMQALTQFATFTLMRPSECFALEWADVDLETMRIRKARRVYRGTLDVPKTGRRTIALTPPGRHAIPWPVTRARACLHE
jgi:integrase